MQRSPYPPPPTPSGFAPPPVYGGGNPIDGANLDPNLSNVSLGGGSSSYSPSSSSYSSYSPSENIRKTTASHSFNTKLWSAYLIITFLVYFLFSAGDFSFIMTAASLGRLFGITLLNVKMWGLGSAEGISLKSIQLYTVVFFFRLTSILKHDGYLPYDKSGDWLYHVIEICSFVMCIVAWYGISIKLQTSYQSSLDRFGAHPPHVPSQYGTVFLIGPMFLLALLIKPNLNSDFLSDFGWCFSMYLESVAIVPQLFMFQKEKSSEVEIMNSHYVSALGLGRLLELVFWLFSYHELVSVSGSRAPGIVAVLAQIVQLALMGDFFYYYYLALKGGGPMVLPRTFDAV